MPLTTTVPDLSGALALLGALLDTEDQPRIAGLQERLGSGGLRVLLVGEAKRGKSTLANTILGRPVLPVGVTPVTAVATLLLPRLSRASRGPLRRRIDGLTPAAAGG